MQVDEAEVDRKYRLRQQRRRQRGYYAATEQLRDNRPWTLEDDRTVLRDDVSIVELAFLLRRAYAQVQGRRAFLHEVNSGDGMSRGLYSIAQAAGILGVNPRTVRRYIRLGRLPVIRISNKVVRISGEGIGQLVQGAMEHPAVKSKGRLPRSLPVESVGCAHPVVYLSGPRAGRCSTCGELEEKA